MEMKNHTMTKQYLNKEIKIKSTSTDEKGNKVVSAEILGSLQLQIHDLFFVE